MEQHLGWDVGDLPGTKKYVELTIHNNGEATLYVRDGQGNACSVSMTAHLAPKVFKDFLVGLKANGYGDDK